MKHCVEHKMKPSPYAVARASGSAALCLLLGVCPSVQAESEYSGQLSTWTRITDQTPEQQIGARYIGELSLSADISANWQLDAEGAFNAIGYVEGDNTDDAEWHDDLDPYRLWLRLASPNFEARGGLQKISFGSASLLRPLMWFDTLDPRDPLQLTDGVYGVLGRYTFANNANIWLWGLYGNDDLRGWEVIPTADDEPEWGGRAQSPLGMGEIALSYHYRKADPSGTAIPGIISDGKIFSEDRLGIDGKWDFVAGLWFEGSVTRKDTESSEIRYLRMLTLGADYTFNLGNGLHLMGEHLISESAEDLYRKGNSSSISALSCGYPIGLFDYLAGFVYYDWQRDDWSPFIQWQRSHDQWQIHISAFYSEKRRPLYDSEQETGFSGSGAHIMFVFNH